MSELDDLRKKVADLEREARLKDDEDLRRDLEGLHFRLRVEYSVATKQLVLCVNDVRATAHAAPLHSELWARSEDGVYFDGVIIRRRGPDFQVVVWANVESAHSRAHVLERLAQLQRKLAPATVTLDVAAADEGLAWAQRDLDAAKKVAKEIAG